MKKKTKKCKAKCDPYSILLNIGGEVVSQFDLVWLWEIRIQYVANVGQILQFSLK